MAVASVGGVDATEIVWTTAERTDLVHRRESGGDAALIRSSTEVRQVKTEEDIVSVGQRTTRWRGCAVRNSLTSYAAAGGGYEAEEVLLRPNTGAELAR